jgi:hypothetical protein
MLMRLRLICIFGCLLLAGFCLPVLLPQPNLADDGEPPSVIYLADLMNNSGFFQRGVTIGSADGDFKFGVEQGTAAFSSVGGVLNYVAIVEAQNLYLPSPPKGTVIRAYDLAPKGAVFMPPLTLSVGYPEGHLPDSNDYLAWWNGSGWVELPSLVNSANATVTAKVRHFTRFAIIASDDTAAAPVMPRTELQVSELKITPAAPKSGEVLTVSVLVTNPEAFSASGPVRLALDGKPVLAQEVALPGAGSRTLIFTLAVDGPGSYSVSVNQLSQTLVVSE